MIYTDFSSFWLSIFISLVLNLERDKNIIIP